MLPTNAARVPVYTPYQRDGFMNFGTNYGSDPSYVNSVMHPVTFKRNSQGVTVPGPVAGHERWVGEVSNHTSEVGTEDFEQATMLWHVLGKEPGHQDRFVGNVAESVSGVENSKLRRMVYGTCRVPFPSFASLAHKATQSYFLMWTKGLVLPSGR